MWASFGIINKLTLRKTPVSPTRRSTMTRSKAAPFALRKYVGVPFNEGGRTLSVTVVKSAKKWIKYRRFNRSIGHGKVKPCVLPSGEPSFYVEIGEFNTIYSRAPRIGN